MVDGLRLMGKVSEADTHISSILSRISLVSLLTHRTSGSR